MTPFLLTATAGTASFHDATTVDPEAAEMPRRKLVLSAVTPAISGSLASYVPSTPGFVSRAVEYVKGA